MRNIILAGIVSIIALASLSSIAQEALTEKNGFPADLVVNLRPQRHIVDNEDWINRPVTNIFGGSDIQRVIVTRDWRKAPLSSRIKAIMALPESNATLERIHAKAEETDFTAIVLLKNGQILEIEIGEEYGMVTSREGSAYFKMGKGTVQPTSGGASTNRANAVRGTTQK